MSFEPFEARDHHLAGRELVPVLAWGSERRENLDKSRLCGRHSAESRAATTIKSRIAVPACSDALICHAAAMRVAQQVGHCLGQLRRIGGLQGPSLGRPDGGDLGHSRKNPPSRDMYAAIARLRLSRGGARRSATRPRQRDPDPRRAPHYAGAACVRLRGPGPLRAEHARRGGGGGGRM